MNSKQTAVEWLENQIKNSKYFYKVMEDIKSKSTIAQSNIFDQAKEMEREQIESAFTHGELFSADYFDVDKPNEDCNKNYYNQTFK